MTKTYHPRACETCSTVFTPTGNLQRWCSPVCSLWGHVDRSGGPEACWPCTLKPTTAGYCLLGHGGEKIYAHRIALESVEGPLGEDMALHRCDNPPCCNPGHLFRGNNSLNIQDCHDKGRRKHTNYATGERHWRSKLRKVA